MSGRKKIILVNAAALMNKIAICDRIMSDTAVYADSVKGGYMSPVSLSRSAADIHKRQGPYNPRYAKSMLKIVFAGMLLLFLSVAVYELDENNKDILYRSVKEGVNIIEGPEVVRYRRFTALDLDQLEAFLSKMPKLP